MAQDTLPHTSRLNHWYKTDAFHVVYTFWPYHPNIATEIKFHHTREHFLNLMLSRFGVKPYPRFPAFSWQEYLSTGVAHLHQGSTCCAFRNVILHLVIRSVYLNYSCLPVSSNQSIHPPRTSDINKAFSPGILALIQYFLFLDPFPVNFRDGCAEKLFSSFCKTQTSLSGTNHHDSFRQFSVASDCFYKYSFFSSF